MPIRRPTRAGPAPIPADETHTEKPEIRADFGRAGGLCNTKAGRAIINLEENPDEHS
jgi:hypothetical protein